MAITLRLVKGSELTFTEVDDNFKSLYYSASISESVLSLWKTGSGTADTVDLSGLTGTTTGSFTGSFTGSVLGTSSYAITASHALNGGSSSDFPYSGSAQITGSLDLTGSFTLLTGNALIGANQTPTTAGGASPTLYVEKANSGYGGDLAIDTTLLLANNSTTYIGAISPTASVAGFYMGSPSDIFGAVVSWGWSQEYLQLAAAQVGHGIHFKVGNKNNNSMKLTPVAAGVSDTRANLLLTGSIDVTGSVTATDNLTVGGNLDIADTIYHTGDSNTKIRFPAVDTIAFNTNGVERLNISPDGHITASGNISSSGTVLASVYTASSGFYANANAGFEFIAEGDNQLNIKHNTANKHIFILTEGSGGINLGTGGTNSQVILNAGHVTASGNISASGGFSGSLHGTSSYAITASHALNAGGGGSAFPHSGSAQITGSLNVTGSTTLHNANNSITSLALQVEGSGSVSGSNIFEVIGDAGTLFAVSDGLSGSLFSVNDVSGIPVLEVRSDDSVLMGNNTAPSFNTTVKVTTLSGSNFQLFTLPTSSYDGVFVDYTLTSGSNARAGNMMAITIPGTQNAQYTDTTTSDIGNTGTCELSAAISESTIRFRADSTGTSTWTFKAIIRAI
jgi:hypothetical protein